MAESDTVSNSSSTLAEVPDVPVLPEDSRLTDTDTDTELVQAAERLDSLTLQPDVDIINTAFAQDTDSVGAASSSSSARDAQDNSRSDDSEEDDVSSAVTDTSEARDVSEQNGSGVRQQQEVPKRKKSLTERIFRPHKDGDGSGKGKGRNPLSVLKRLTKFDKTKYKKGPQKNAFSEFEQVRIDRLPQVFVAKYLGMREVHGFCGLQHVRKPVDEMVTVVQKNLERQEQVELPLVYVVVSPKGLDVREHKQNKQKGGVPAGLVPIDFISYGVQDIKYWRVFTFIVVKELSSRSKVTECHAYLCDSSRNARKMALSLGASFKIYSRNLKKEGKFHNFQVELRPPDELAEAIADPDCDA
ncbi:uncharacterized protein LOC143290367 [Babylonia areolata]|uniref:uncharacterized protein LOC143290367 n=1 Tax=Babylonia areolata TaxID=304850 RepID=UPI003FD4FEEA